MIIYGQTIKNYSSEPHKINFCEKKIQHRSIYIPKCAESNLFAFDNFEKKLKIAKWQVFFTIEQF